MPWWFDFSPGFDWTDEEQKVRRRIGLIAMVIIWPLISPEVWLLEKIGVDGQIVVLVGLATAGPMTFYFACKICGCCWPELVKKADTNAFKRLANKRV